MSEGSLSQEEINALFSQTDTNRSLSIDDFLTPIEQDALGEIGNISLGSSTTALSALLNQRVEITTPTLEVVEQDRMVEMIKERQVAVFVDYTKGITGKNLLMIKEDDAKIIANLMMGGDGTSIEEELTELHISAVQEAMNQMMGSAATSMSTMLHQKVDISPPTIDLVDFPPDRFDHLEGDIIIKVIFRLKVGILIDSIMVQLIPLSFGRDLIQQILSPGSMETAATSTLVAEHPVPSAVQSAPAQSATNSAPVHAAENARSSQARVNENMPYAATNPAFANASAMSSTAAPQPSVANAHVQKVEYATFGEAASTSPSAVNLDMLYDIPLEISVELGRTDMPIRKILELGPGAVIQLSKLAGEPVDILANHKLIAKGEVVVIEENFGVRITDIISPLERLTKMTM